MLPLLLLLPLFAQLKLYISLILLTNKTLHTQYKAKDNTNNCTNNEKQ